MEEKEEVDSGGKGILPKKLEDAEAIEVIQLHVAKESAGKALTSSETLFNKKPPVY